MGRASRSCAALPGLVALAALTAIALAGCTAGTWFQPDRPVISVSVANPCPPTLGKANDVADHVGLSSSLLPKSLHFSASLVCAYKDRALTTQTKLAAKPTRELAAAVSKIDLAAPKGRYGCPAAGYDAVTIIAFQDGHTDNFDLWWQVTGCQTLDNGRLGAFEGANPSFYQGFLGTFDRLVPTESLAPGHS